MSVPGRNNQLVTEGGGEEGVGHSPRSGYPGRFDILDVREHEFDGIHRRLARDEDHCMHVGEKAIFREKTIIRRLGAPHGVFVWQFAARSARIF